MNARSGAQREDVPQWVLDALLGAGIAVVIASIIALGQGEYRASGFVAYLFAVGFGALMPVRHRAPRVMLFTTMTGIVVYYALDYPPIGVALPLGAALYAAAEAGYTCWAIGAGVLMMSISLVFRVREGESLAYLVGYEGMSNAALIVTAIALGAVVRSRRVQVAQQAEITRLTAERSERQAQLRIRDERTRLSRDLHDTVGHAISVISLQAGVAAEAIGHDDRLARTAIGHILDTSKRSLRDVRSLVRVLRGENDGDAASVISLAGVPDLVRTARNAGLETTCELSVISDRLAPQVDATAYRVIQEALTNIICHADATRVTVTAGIDNGVLRVTIGDNGTVAATADEEWLGGHGLAGMRERVRLLGGTLSVGPRPEVGFLVDARIPIEVPE